MHAIHHSPSTTSLSLYPNVLGGADAVEFSTLVHELGEKGVTNLIVDMSAVQVMNSSGLGMLVASLSTMRKFGGIVKFVAVPDKVNALLKMTHLDTVFEIYPTTQDALHSQ